MQSLNSAVTNFFKLLQVSSSSPLVRLFLTALALSQSILPTGWPEDFKLAGGERFDFIVVGSGSAGSIVAARLSEVPHWKILLLEAGGDPPPTSVIPSLFSTLAHTEYDWDYRGQLDPGVGSSHPNREVYMIRGKMLGGSSALNYLIHSRGVPQDYDEWAQVAPGWDWNSVVDDFKKLENMTDPSVFQNPYNARLHSTEGPVKVSRPKSDANINNIFLNSFEEIGMKRVLENNGPELYGISQPHFIFADGRRSSTAESYLRPNAKRRNLYVAKYARATKILINPYTSRAYGVEVSMKGGKTLNVFTNYEVIISTGAIDSPKLLMLSGIGPREELLRLNIDIVANLPVGKNLQDHPWALMAFNGKFGIESALINLQALAHLDSFPVPIQSGFFRLNNSRMGNKPQFQIFNIYVGAAASPLIKYGCSVIGNFDDYFCNSIAKANLFNENSVMLFIYLHPRSRGQILLKSKNPLDNPIIEMGYLRNEEDLSDFVEGVKYITKLAETSYFRKVKGSVAKLDVKACRYLIWGTDDYWRCYVKNIIGSMLHPVGTCKMGPDGVVDERLRVHGVEGLRVVDASIMPTIPSGNTNTPTMMIGEKAASIIMQDYSAIMQFPNFI